MGSDVDLQKLRYRRGRVPLSVLSRGSINGSLQSIYCTAVDTAEMEAGLTSQRLLRLVRPNNGRGAEGIGKGPPRGVFCRRHLP